MAPAGGGRLVEVAVDAPGVPGGRTFTYHVPAALAPLQVGEAVVVEYGRQQTIGIVLSDGGESSPTLDLEGARKLDMAGADADGAHRPTKPVLGRIHSDGPLLPALTARLALHVASHYMAPPGMVVRAMLPPGLLERVELIVRAVSAVAAPPAVEFGAPETGRAPARRSGGSSADAGRVLSLVRAAGEDGIAVSELEALGEARPQLLRQIRDLEDGGQLEISWRVRPPGARPRLERIVWLTDEGREAADRIEADEPLEGRPLGPKQRELLVELASAETDEPVPAAQLAERFGASAVTGLARRGLLELDSRARARRPLADRAEPTRGALPADAPLTEEQRRVVERVAPLIRARTFAGMLVDGVTAGGKTAVYAAAIREALDGGRPALVLVPEIALAVPLIDRLRHDLGVEIAVVHSGLGEGERADEWRRIRAGDVRVVVGTRLAVLAPLADVGVVVVDDEHDAAYKSDRTPRYQARDVALELGRLAGAPVILGSATPDVVSIGRTRRGELERFSLPDRASGRRPDVEIVDLRDELASGNRGLISEVLIEALTSLDREAGEQAILVINRRGSASVVLCRDCGYVQVCPECERPLVFHAASMALRCHHCGATAPVARRCPACGSPRIRYLGGGTQRVEHELQVRLPDVRVARLDRDVVERRGEAVRVLDRFAAGATDVLVGTGLVAKGLDVPEVTLVGVVSADVALSLPDERAAERTWQLLEQAVGRAGRGERPGRAIVQTYRPEHAAIQAVATGDSRAFVDEELERRERFGSPPYGSVIKLTAALEDRDAAEAAAKQVAVRLRERAAALGARVAVLGPVPAYVARRGGRWRFHVVLRGTDPRAVLGEDPGQPWSIDVDPESLL
jgi:primosomal protein N' (replication factor Y)